MGIGYAVAAGILLIGTAVMGFDLAGRAFDAQEEIGHAMDDFQEILRHHLHAHMVITDVSVPDPGELEVTVRNDGAVDLDARFVTLVIDGAPAPVQGWTVNGVDSNVWASGTVLVLHVTASTPSAVLVFEQYGSRAVWRA